MTALWTVILVGGIVAAYVACARHLGRVTHGPAKRGCQHPAGQRCRDCHEVTR